MRPARPASSPVLRGRRVSPDTLMLRQPETAGPAGPLALQKRDTFRTAPVFPVFLLGLFLAFRETVYGEHWTSIVPCCSFSEWGGADPRSRAGRDCGGRAPRAGLARRAPHPAHAHLRTRPEVVTPPAVRRSRPVRVPEGHTGPSVLWLGGRGHRPSVAECAARWRTAPGARLDAHVPSPPPVWRVRTGREVEPRGGVGVLTGAAESSPTGDRGCAMSQPALSRRQARALLPDGENRAPLSAVTTQSADHGQVLNVQ